MFDHVGLNVSDYRASRFFYERALAPLGYGVVMAFDEWKAAGFGTADKPEFWVSERVLDPDGNNVEAVCHGVGPAD
jgi:catechol 2,3-dioxygenase-like lactoylglutathione lyase family enzyme